MNNYNHIIMNNEQLNMGHKVNNSTEPLLDTCTQLLILTSSAGPRKNLTSSGPEYDGSGNNKKSAVK